MDHAPQEALQGDCPDLVKKMLLFFLSFFFQVQTTRCCSKWAQADFALPCQRCCSKLQEEAARDRGRVWSGHEEGDRTLHT